MVSTLTRPVRPSKLDQAAALIRLVFEQNRGVALTLQDVEDLVSLEGFSPSTRQRALNHLATSGTLRWVGTVYWMPEEES